MAGKAIVDATIEPSKNGRVRFQGSWWSARCEQETTIFPGEMVRVVGRQNITLIVEPVVEPVVEAAIEPVVTPTGEPVVEAVDQPVVEREVEQEIEPVKPMPFVAASAVASTTQTVSNYLPSLNELPIPTVKMLEK
jgi:hypothetical protein